LQEFGLQKGQIPAKTKTSNKKTPQKSKNPTSPACCRNGIVTTGTFTDAVATLGPAILPELLTKATVAILTRRFNEKLNNEQIRQITESEKSACRAEEESM
jgi:hypothetical protein